MNLIARYTHWLHTRWPAGRVEPLPVVEPDGSTNVPGLFIAGDLGGVPLLKIAADSGAATVQRIAADLKVRPVSEQTSEQHYDLAIVGGGVAGMSAALEAKRLGLRFVLFEASEPFSTIVNFPKAKPIFTYPTGMQPRGQLQFHEKSDVREGLIEDLREQIAQAGIESTIARIGKVNRSAGEFAIVPEEGSSIRAKRVLIAVGRSGDYRTLGVEGEDLDHVSNRLHDPKDFARQHVVVVGGGDSAVETAIALAQHGANVVISYRGDEFTRPKPANIEQLNTLEAAGGIEVLYNTHVTEITTDDVAIRDANGSTKRYNAHQVFIMIGREAPNDFLRRCGVRIRGDWNAQRVAGLVLFLAFCVWLYHWKKESVTIAPVPPFSWIAEIGAWWKAQGWFPYDVPQRWSALGGAFSDPASLLGTLKVSLGEPGFYYSFAYCLCVALFGVARIRRRRTPYVTWQTIALILIQCIPLFLLPYILLPWMGSNGWFESGAGKWFADEFFPQANYGHGREYWRAFGLILAWPLFIWNLFTTDPMWGWLVVSVVQTFVLIPLMIWRWGKGAYCGWICSCGALAETMGDRHRDKMPHGPGWNRFNMLGQVFLFFALAIMVLRTIGWIAGPDSWATGAYHGLLYHIPIVNYVWFVDLFWAGILGVGLYFWFSGRVWCRFACPLAALMHIYTRFSRFRIFADKKKCISCNVCTTVCHQGIDVMAFANKGEPMADVQCVRCSACVQMCPTGVLSFGRYDREGQVVLDRLAASPVQMAELTVGGKRV